MNDYNDYYLLTKPPFGLGRALCITFNTLLGLFFGLMLCGVPSYWSETGKLNSTSTVVAALFTVLAIAPFTAAALIALFARPAWMRGFQWFVFGTLLALALTFFVFGILPAEEAVQGEETSGEIISGEAASAMLIFMSVFFAALAGIAFAVARWVKRFTLVHE